MSDYRTFLRAIGRRPVNLRKLRTAKKPGDLEIVHDRRVEGSYRLHRYQNPLMED